MDNLKAIQPEVWAAMNFMLNILSVIWSNIGKLNYLSCVHLLCNV